jgi:Spy/CpxP family protein refolding chaperone
MRIQRIVPGLAIVIAGSLAALPVGAAVERAEVRGGPRLASAQPELPAGDEWLAAAYGDMEAGDEDLMAQGPMPGQGGMMQGRGMRGPRGRMGMHHPGGRPGMAAMQRLDLTDAQREKLRGIHDQAARRQIELRAKIATARLDLRKLMRADKPDLAAINAQIDRLAQWRAGAEKARVAAMLEARGVLTPDQRRMLREGPRMRGRMRPGMKDESEPGTPGDGQ